MTGLDLKIKRIKAGKKQYQVAAQVGICQTVLCDIESGRRKLKPALCARILSCLANSDNKHETKP